MEPAHSSLIKASATDTVIDICSPAAGVADRLLRDVGTRIAHSARVANQVDSTRHLLDGPWRSAILDAAWLHDVGYSELVASTGFHSLDGARWLRNRGWPDETCRLVAWHTAASTESTLRGLDHELKAEFAPPPPVAGAALTWGDLTASPRGERWSVSRRIFDILRRHPPDSVVHRAIVAALPELRDATRQIESQLHLGAVT
jgi:hypothetical protein